MGHPSNRGADGPAYLNRGGRHSSASLVAIIVILQAVGFPEESIAIGVGIVYVVDRILDMTRTAVNVLGDSCAAAIIGKSEGETGYYSSLRS